MWSKQDTSGSLENKSVSAIETKIKYCENTEKTEGQMFLLISNQKCPFISMKISAQKMKVWSHLTTSRIAKEQPSL